MDLITFLIKGLVISGYDPAEDLIEGGMDFLSNPIRSLLKKYRESVGAQLKNENFTYEQIKTVKKVLAESNDRFITNSVASIYENKADAMQISRKIFKSFQESNEFSEVSSQTKICLTDETENEKIIKGIAIIIGKAVSLVLTSPDYTEYLTIELNRTTEAVRKTMSQVDNHDERLNYYDNWLIKHEQCKKQNTDGLGDRIKEYQNYAMGLYTKRISGNSLLGEESLSDLYMQPYYYESEHSFGDVEGLLENFCLDEQIRVLWIVGEPGHGKTSMCLKAVADYVNKKRYLSTKGVFWFKLNPSYISEMIDNHKLILRCAFSWGITDGERSQKIEPQEIEGSLVLLDGFDELKASLAEFDISNNQFYTQVNQLANAFNLHIVVTSRTRALEQTENCTEEALQNGTGRITCKYSDGGSENNPVYLLAPLSDQQQTDWIDGLIRCRKANQINTSELEHYRSKFQSLQRNEEIKELLKIPIIVRMVVHNCYEPKSDNRVWLYRDLFDKTLRRQGKTEKQIKDLHKVYREIAYKIFVHDGYSTELNKDEFKNLTVSDAYLYQYYLHTPWKWKEYGTEKANMYQVAFLHGSFYQYFLSEFFYDKLLEVKDISSGENVLRYLWARRLDPYVLENLQYLTKKVDYKWILSAIDKTDCIMSDYASSSESKECIGNYDKANNTFWNAVSAWNYISQRGDNKEKIRLPERIVKLISKYDCSGISLSNVSLCSADLSCADLRAADLRDADIRNANLSTADLTFANLKNADLSYANLSTANLSNADLNNANLSYANLSTANLSAANLNMADLSNADLHDSNMSTAILRHSELQTANLSNANLRYAKMSNANLKAVYLSAADLHYADLHSAKLYSADLSGADLHNANLDSASLSNANLSLADLGKANLSSADLCYADLRSADLSSADLSSADLSSANLSSANLNSANLCATNLSTSNLTAANLRFADLRDGNLSIANLREADLSCADLRNVDLSSAKLISCDLHSADLRNANLRYADLSNSNFYFADLGKADLRFTTLFDVELVNAIMTEADVENAQVTRRVNVYITGKKVKNLNKIKIINSM